ncbi:hypothetical protein ES332_A08G088000v1 [Gossypium tomentosum]|uniref:SANTA domain-containing protein n=1 Tax=Gossypium tomentosum TaxID=34277 RepID=A0A5D2PBW9_GOSTO|nr:hypothetical protein ES332_A08G088000v1 [Gossypium tomentosum]
MGKRNRERRKSEKPCKSDQLVAVPIGSPTPLANLSLNSVVLHDWWLCMVQPKGLAVGGFQCRGRQGQRVLCSAAIAKRHDATTLETADGITVAISGFINTSRTLQNGFSPKVCSHFLFGFPYDWEEYASHSNEQSFCSSTEASSTTSLLHSNAMSLPLPSLDNLHVPAARIRDLLMLSAGDSPNSVFDHMLLQKLSTHDFQNAESTTADSNMGNKDPKDCPYSVADGENSNCHKEKVIQNHVDDNNILCSRSKTTVGSWNEDVSILTPPNTRGVITRSMTRLKRRTSERLKRLRLSSSELKEKVLRR